MDECKIMQVMHKHKGRDVSVLLKDTLMIKCSYSSMCMSVSESVSLYFYMVTV